MRVRKQSKQDLAKAMHPKYLKAGLMFARQTVPHVITQQQLGDAGKPYAHG